MRKLALLLPLVAVACGSHDHPAARLMAFDVAQPSAEEPAPPQPNHAPAPDAPQIAYTYTIGYRLGAEDVASVQARHVALCDSLGPARCRIVSMDRDSGESGSPEANLSLLVDARIARAFGDRLDAAASRAGGSVASRGIEAADLSKQIVDTDARLRGKEALTQRLLVLLRNRTGKVGELVEAERAYAQAQEELDAARSWLADMRRRVAMSRIDVRYAGIGPQANSLWQPVRDSLGEAGQTLGTSLSRLIGLLLAALPWLLFLWLLLWGGRRLGWRRPRLPWPRRGRIAAPV
jgi:hypothetical protein